MKCGDCRYWERGPAAEAPTPRRYWWDPEPDTQATPAEPILNTWGECHRLCPSSDLTSIEAICYDGEIESFDTRDIFGCVLFEAKG